MGSSRTKRGSGEDVLCNADEGDPGAFILDRSILQGDPHAVLEGMIIAAKAMRSPGATHGRAQPPPGGTIAIEQARECGLLGEDIGSDFSLDLEVYQKAGAFVCGEETAPMASIQGKRHVTAAVSGEQARGSQPSERGDLRQYPPDHHTRR